MVEEKNLVWACLDSHRLWYEDEAGFESEDCDYGGISTFVKKTSDLCNGDRMIKC